MTNFDDVGSFHELFELPFTGPDAVPHHIDDQQLVLFRLKFLLEELNELIDGYALDRLTLLPVPERTPNLPGIADALVDLVYVALGTAHLHGLPWDELFREVHRTNMTKVRARHAADSTRASAFDVVKPPGWQPPKITKILVKHGWKP